MAATPDIRVTDNSSESQFEARIADELAGVIEYELADDTITLTHTRVFEHFSGMGVAGALVREALDSVRNEGSRKVIPECTYVAGWMEKHPDYQDLAAEGVILSEGDDD